MSEFLIERLEEFGERMAVAEAGHTATYAELRDRYEHWQSEVAKNLQPGDVVTIEGEYGVESIAVLLALLRQRCILVPLSSDSASQHEGFRELSMAEARVRVDAGEIVHTGTKADHPMYEQLRSHGKGGHAGLVLFTSGSTGASKAAVHDLDVLLEKFEPRRHAFRTIVFLQLDHIGGVNTLLYTLSNGGAAVVPEDRSPRAVCEAIERHAVELLPTSPTFLNLLLLSGEYERHDCSSLERITYGTEPMPESTLTRIGEVFKEATLQQTYGLTELGILRSKSKDNGSLWVRVGGEGFDTKVVDKRLWVKARSAMLGYLNAPSPFDEEGYFDTGDTVEVEGEWLRILGRESEIINVGGNKVYPRRGRERSAPARWRARCLGTRRSTSDHGRDRVGDSAAHRARSAAPIQGKDEALLPRAPTAFRSTFSNPRQRRTALLGALQEDAMNLHDILKSSLNGLAMVLTAPFGLLCRLESQVSRGEGVFGFFSHCFAVLPGVPGLFLRRGFYRWTLGDCSPNCHIGFGALFTHRETRVEDDVYIGNYALIGRAKLHRGALIGSRVSLLSGGQQHQLLPDGSWGAAEVEAMRQIDIGANVWIGEGSYPDGRHWRGASWSLLAPLSRRPSSRE